MKEIYHSRNNREKLQKHELLAGDARAVIDSHGAFVTELYDGDWQILFRKGEYVNSERETKIRGGMHPCIPNFGPAAPKYNLPQHGPARNEDWDAYNFGDGAIHFHNNIGRLETSIMYELSENSLATTLMVKNQGYDPEPIAPGFHPYFNVGEQNEIIINGKVYNLDKDAKELADTVYMNDVITLEIGERIIRFENKNLNHFAIWYGGEMDEEGNRYICVEPTAEGQTFEAGNTPSTLPPNEEKTFSFKISW